MAAWADFLTRFQERAEAQPGAPAVCHGDTCVVSYGELLRRAAGLGTGLRRRGAGPEAVVGLCLEKSPELVAAMLAAWWAGAAFLPLDPHLPAERLAFMVRDAGVRLAVAAPPSAAALEALGVGVLEASAGTREPGPLLPAQRPGPEQLAYVIYTSGSTGRPKGVLVPHRGVVNLIAAQIPVFQLARGCRALWLLSSSFDASISDVGTALLSGATLCVEPEPLRQGRPLEQVLGQRGITHLDLPPALLRVLDPNAMPSCLRTLVIGGEASPPEVVRRWARRFRVINVYGPTEATVCTSLCACDPDRWDQPLLGRPIPGVGYHVLDDRLGPVPPGATGELFIGGAGLARGYLNQPELTARKFPVVRGERLYRTGDRVLRRGDGELVFLGRVDRQVKVRGLLVEPEEVEQRLLQHPAVLHAAVLKRPLGGEREGLVAFVVARPGAARPGPADLRRSLAQALPAWMLPQRVEWVEELPATAAGKVDLALLATTPLPEPVTVPPAEGAEEADVAVLRAVWRRVLGRDPVSLTEGFFEQGGDSLALIEAVVLARAHGLIVPPALLAEGRTIREIADHLRGRAAAQLGSLSPSAGKLPSCPTAPAGAMACAELRREADDPEWQEIVAQARARPAGGTIPQTPRAVLLTGATGFLGSRLLGELLARTDADVFCLVRATSAAHGLDRITRALARQGVASLGARQERLRVVAGDLASPRLGLGSAEWDRLACEVDTVHHCGAWVNLVLPYRTLRPANVLGSREVVRLLATGRRKRLHYASTLSVFVATDRNRGRLLEGDTLEQTGWVYGGYAQTKWAAEWVLRSAGAAAGPMRLYRLGLITGDTTAGRAGDRDFLTLFLRGLARLGCVPDEEEDLFLDITPVDYAASALAHLSLTAADDFEPTTYHVANTRALPLRELVAGLEEFGVRLERVPPGRWRERLDRLPPGHEGAAACLALCRAEAGDSFGSYRTMDLFQATGVTFDQANTRGGLAGSGIACPPPDRELLRVYFRHAFSRRPEAGVGGDGP
jgi:amino acid adenylation domain-containing protein/thioester reductase-like protein